MNVKPLGNRVVIKVNETAEEVVGGIILPETAKKIPNQGEILAVGPGKFENGELQPMNVKVGDQVIYIRHAGSDIDIDEEGDYIIISQDNILAVIE